MRERIAAQVRHHVGVLVAPWIALLGCDRAPNPGPVTCGYVLNLALLHPASSQLNIGDTLTMGRTWDAGVARQCLPPDTSAAGVRWSTPDGGVVAIDSMTGHLTARRPGMALIYLSQVGVTDAALGSAGADVYEPPGADSVVTIIRNGTYDSALVVLEDAHGTVQRSGTVPGADSTCWVTPLSDSLRYTAVVYVAPPSGPDSATAPWTAHAALQFSHTIRIHIYYDSPGVPAWTPAPVSPDPGTGCF